MIKSLEAELSTLGDALRKARQDIAVMERGRSTIRWNTDKVARMTMELARQTAAELKSRQSTSTLLKTHLDEARERADSGVDKAALLDAESIIRDLRTEVTKWEGLWTSSKARYTTLEADVKEKGEVITKYQQENWKEAYDELRSEYEADKSKFRIEIQEMEGIQREMLKDLDKKAESQKSTPHSKKISKILVFLFEANDDGYRQTKLCPRINLCPKMPRLNISRSCHVFGGDSSGHEVK